MKKTLFLFLFGSSLIMEMHAQTTICIIQTSKRGYTDGEYGIDSSKMIFSYPSLLNMLSDESSGDVSTYSMYDERYGRDYGYKYVIQNDTLYQYYEKTKMKSKPIMYLKGDDIYLGSYYNQNNGIKDYVFDNTLVGTITGNSTSGFGILATAGLSDETTIARCKDDCPYGLMAAYSYIFTPGELMDDY